MTHSPNENEIDVYLEIGKKRTFAGALYWPGWCRSGSDERAALQALFDYGPRYGRVLRGTRLGFQVPPDPSAFVVIERLEGNATTDFGAPAVAAAHDSERVDAAELRRFEKLFNACWRTFDSATAAARGKPLRTGPRGGGRDVEGIIRHVLGGDGGYLNALGWKLKQGEAYDLDKIRKAILSAVRASARGEIPARGPRGGVRWSARYFVRRAIWHELDHAWEIEDRLEPIIKRPVR